MAVILFSPTFRLLPFTARVAVAVLAETVSDTEPSCVVPSINETVPVGAMLPDTGFTVATTCVLAVCANDAGVADTLMDVATTGGVTVTTTNADVEAKVWFPS